MRFTLAMLLVLCFTSFALAAETSGPTYTSPNGEINQEFPGLLDCINNQDYIQHTHQYDKDDRDNPVGLGVDVIVYQNEAKNIAVEVQEKYDVANEENSIYAVMKLNLFEMLTKKKNVE